MVDKNIWEGWEITEQIGSGGFGEVYKMRKLDDDEDYFSALKVISIPRDEQEYQRYMSEGYDHEGTMSIFKSQVDRIVAEFKLMRKFRGITNIVNYEDHRIIPKKDSYGWNILIRMELLTPLTEYCAQRPADESMIIKLGTDICTALEHCEKFNIVHRDVKPQNIFVNSFGDFKLGDFGIARVMDHATHATRVGTPSYIAPEVYNNGAVDSRADIYCLGMVLYWLLNEKRLPFMPLPYEQPTATAIDRANMLRLNGEPLSPPKNGCPALKTAVMRALAFNPNARFFSLSEFKEALTKANNVAAVNATSTVNSAPVNNSANRMNTASSLNYNYTQRPIAPPVQKKKDKTWLWVTIALVGVLIAVGVILSNIFSGNTGKMPLPSGPVGGYESGELSFEVNISLDYSVDSEEELSFYVDSTGEQDSSIESEEVVEITSISIATMPYQTVFYVDENIDTAGITIRIHYSNGTSEITEDGFDISHPHFGYAGKKTVTVMYGEHVTTYTVDVVDRVVMPEPDYGSLAVVPAGKTNYAAKATYTIYKNNIAMDPFENAGDLFLADNSFMVPYETWGDLGLTKLTDGITAAGEDMDIAGALEGVTVAFVGSNAKYEFIIDLGQTRYDISSVAFYGVRDGYANGNSRGFNVDETMVYVSNTPTGWTGKLQDTSFTRKEIAGAPLIMNGDGSGSDVENFIYTFNLDTPAEGRYVKIVTSSPVFVLQFDEIMVLN